MFIQILGANVYYEQHGETGPQVLLLHGWGCATTFWKPVVDELSGCMRLTALDFPGHGQSGRPPEPWGVEDFAMMTALFIERLGLTGCAVVGHSHGGRTAIQLASGRPELLGKLVLVAAAGLRKPPSAKQSLRQHTFKALRSLCDGAEKLRVFGTLPEKARATLRSCFGSPDYKALDEEMRKTFVKVVNADLGSALPRVRASTLLIWGDKDTETPLWMGKKMEQDIPDAGLVVLEGGSHFAYLEQTGRFCRIVKHFLVGG